MESSSTWLFVLMLYKDHLSLGTFVYYLIYYLIMVFLSVAIYGNLTIQGKYFLNDLSCWVE